ncbi:MAG TPA: 3-keto-5-aminohexanoate cleavage protein [Syntrophales bacterium]|nr:3-keto-5-aminohexanoate cleavage protein [Syntrophales bacterium]
MNRKVIVTCALVGSSTRKNQNPNTPYSPEELADAAELAYRAGAAMVHVHAVEDDGANSIRIERIKESHDAIKARVPELIVNMTSALGPGATPELRLEQMEAVRPEMSSLNMATMNFAAVNRKTGEVLVDYTFENSLIMVAKFAARMKEIGTKPEIEVYSSSGIDNYHAIAGGGSFTEPVNFNFVWGVCGGNSFRPGTFIAMASSLPPGANFTTCGVGNDEWPAITQSILCGGHVRVGLEDNIRMPDGALAKGNYELVEHAVRIVRALGHEPATPDEARAIMGTIKR